MSSDVPKTKIRISPATLQAALQEVGPPGPGRTFRQWKKAVRRAAHANVLAREGRRVEEVIDQATARVIAGGTAHAPGSWSWMRYATRTDPQATLEALVALKLGASAR